MYYFKMGNFLYVMYGCPICAEAELGVIQANVSLTPSEKIQIVFINSNRPELAMLQKIFKSNSPEDWQVPLLVLSEKGINRTFDSYVPTNNKNRVKVLSVFHREHMLEYIRTYLGRGM